MFVIDRLLPKQAWKNVWLALASIVFYAFGQLAYVPLFLGSVVLNYGMGLLLRGDGSHRKAAVAAAVVLNLGILCVFKYTGLVTGTLRRIPAHLLPCSPSSSPGPS